MKKKIGAIALACVMLLTVCVYAVSGDTDITNDPLISLSYLNEVFWPKIETAIEKAINGEDFKNNNDDDSIWWDPDDETTEDTEEAAEDTSEETTAEEEVPAAGQFYEVLELKKDDILVSTTPCEIILRSGSATAYLDGNGSGIADLTNGDELWEGNDLTKNHLLLIPRGDGRGLKVGSDVAFIMVRGGYEIVK